MCKKKDVYDLLDVNNIPKLNSSALSEKNIHKNALKADINSSIRNLKFGDRDCFVKKHARCTTICIITFRSCVLISLPIFMFKCPIMFVVLML